jgi:hypothetical protein
MIQNTINNYYVYGHYRNDTGTLFYVGKGKKRRAFRHENRNDNWHSIAKSGYTVFFFYKNLPEQLAFDLEKAVIADTCPEANISRGGHATLGFLGKKHTAAHRQKMSDLYRGRQMRKMDDSYRQDLRRAALKRAKKVLDLETGIIYESIRACSRAIGINKTSVIKRIAKGIQLKVV